jgi:molybdopterin synthase catalytic subunit
MVEVYEGAIPVEEVLARWLEETRRAGGLGAFIPFVGIVRAEGGIEGLSFDLYLPLLEEWFKRWEERAEKAGLKLFMAHSFGDVGIGETSFVTAVASPHRQEGFQFLPKFVDDFKKNAPIWKFDLKGGKRIFVMERAVPLPHAGILGED